MYKLNGASGIKTGLGITLRVMSGDVVDIFGKSYYHLNSGQTPDNSYSLFPTALLNLLANFIASTAVHRTPSESVGK